MSEICCIPLDYSPISLLSISFLSYSPACEKVGVCLSIPTFAVAIFEPQIQRKAFYRHRNAVIAPLPNASTLTATVSDSR